MRKRRPKGRQVRAKKANVSKPPMECRKRSDDVETGVELLLRDEPERYLLTAQAASGIKAARAWFRLLRGTCEPAASIQGLTDDEPGSLPRGRISSSGNCERPSTDARRRDGPPRSSEEAR